MTGELRVEGQAEGEEEVTGEALVSVAEATEDEVAAATEAMATEAVSVVGTEDVEEIGEVSAVIAEGGAAADAEAFLALDTKLSKPQCTIPILLKRLRPQVPRLRLVSTRLESAGPLPLAP